MWKEYTKYTFSLKFRADWNAFLKALGLSGTVPSARISQHVAQIMIEKLLSPLHLVVSKRLICMGGDCCQN